MTEQTAGNYANAQSNDFDPQAVVHWWRKAIAAKGKSSLICMVRATILSGYPDALPGIDLDLSVDTIVYGFQVRRQRIDIAVFHADGSMTVVEARDGAAGMTSVLAGIGQVTMHALHVGAQDGKPKTIRKALLWNSVGNLDHDPLIELCCRRAGVIPMQFGPLELQIAIAALAVGELDGA